MNLRSQSFVAAFAACLFVSSVSADNWPHWRGDNGNGVSLSAKPPTEWSDTKNVAWKVDVPGLGSGSPVIWEDSVFVTTAVRTGKGSERIPELDCRVICYDRSTGKEKWNKSAIVATPPESTHSTNGFASASPCTDGAHLYAHFGSQGTFCFTMDGELIWSRTDLGKMVCRGEFGEGSSPTLAGERLLIPWDHEGQSKLYCLDKQTGKTIWETLRDEPSCWATPLVISANGQQQVVLNGQNYARSYDLETGKELWKCGGQTQRPVACPVSKDGLVFVGSGFRGSFLGAFRPTGKGDIQGTSQVAWSVSRNTPDIASPLLSENRLFYTKGKSGILTCVNADTGKPFFDASRVAGLQNLYASPIAANGHVYITDRSGTTVVLKDSQSLEIVATNRVGETVDATPAPVDDQLFIRGEDHLFCIQEK